MTTLTVRWRSEFFKIVSTVKITNKLTLFIGNICEFSVSSSLSVFLLKLSQIQIIFLVWFYYYHLR